MLSIGTKLAIKEPIATPATSQAFVKLSAPFAGPNQTPSGDPQTVPNLDRIVPNHRESKE